MGAALEAIPELPLDDAQHVGGRSGHWTAISVDVRWRAGDTGGRGVGCMRDGLDFWDCFWPEGNRSMSRILKRLYMAVAWRLHRLRAFLYHAQDVAFWEGTVDEAPWYPDLEKLHEIARAIGFETRQAAPEDLPLLREYHDRVGRPLGRRRIRKLRERWAAGDECYVALDRHGDVVAYMWAAYNDHYLEAIHDVVQVGPTDALSYDVDTRSDKRGSMGFLACSCAAIAGGLRRGRRRGISWCPPELFEKFARLHWFSGLGKPRLLRIERCRCVCGIRSRRVIEGAEDPSAVEPQEDAQ